VSSTVSLYFLCFDAALHFQWTVIQQVLNNLNMAAYVLCFPFEFPKVNWSKCIGWDWLFSVWLLLFSGDLQESTF
jgi:hypothetical protein